MEDNTWMPEFPNQFTKDQVDFMNSEVEDTPEVRAIFQRIADEMLMESAKKEAEGAVRAPSGPDLERQLMDNLDLFEEYIRITVEREPLQKKWEILRYRRNTWWSLFREEMDFNWMRLDLFDQRFNKWVETHIKERTKPTGKQWREAKAMRSLVFKECKKMVSRRWDTTNKVFLKAMDATRACQAFWRTEEGMYLSQLNDLRSTLWNQIQELDVTFEDYNNLLQTEFNPYWTTGDTEEVDTMELMANTTYEYLDMLEDASHEEDSAMFEAGSSLPGYWDRKEAARSHYKAQSQKADWEADEAWQRTIDEVKDAEDAWEMSGGNPATFLSFL